MDTTLTALGQFLTSHHFAIFYAVLVLLSPYYFKRTKNSSSVQSSAVSLGILGTFLGIFGGMLQFDVKDIQASIPVLLAGLQLAFLTPIAGMVASLVFKHCPQVYFFKESEETETDADQLILIRQELVGIAKSLSGEEDTTLLSQIQKLRMAMIDKHDELKKSFDKFAHQMAENNMRSLIDAVNKVMEDFNTKINDQLGQSFRELSDSVRALVEWQENYILTVQQSTGALGSAQESLKNSAVSLQSTSEKVSEIAENNRQISEINQEFKTVIENLNEMLGSTVGFSHNMKILADSLDGSGETLKVEVRAIVEESIENMQTHAEDVSKNINSITATAMKNMQEKNTETLQNFEELNQKTLQDFGGHLASIAGKLADDFAKVQEALSLKIT